MTQPSTFTSLNLSFSTTIGLALVICGLNISIASLTFAISSLSSNLHTPAAKVQQQPTIYTDSFPYPYLGCFNETTGVHSKNSARALAGFNTPVGTGNTTVPVCLGFCDGGPGLVYKSAGLECSGGFWCAWVLNGLPVKLDDSACTMQGGGNATELCGGPLKFSVYFMASNPAMTNTSAMGRSSAVISNASTGSNSFKASSSKSMVVASWMVMWVAAVMVIVRD